MAKLTSYSKINKDYTLPFSKDGNLFVIKQYPHIKSL